MRILQDAVNRRSVIEAYAKYDFQKKRHGERLPDFDKWNWSSADALDEQLQLAGLKTGIPAGYHSWNMVKISIPDLRECAVVSGIFASQRYRQLGLIEQNWGLTNWDEMLLRHLGDRQVPEWYDQIKRGQALTESAPFLLRPSVSNERPARWYVEDGSGRAVTLLANAHAFALVEMVAVGFLGTVPDANSTFMRTRFAEFLR